MQASALARLPPGDSELSAVLAVGLLQRGADAIANRALADKLHGGQHEQALWHKQRQRTIRAPPERTSAGRYPLASKDGNARWSSTMFVANTESKTSNEGLSLI